VNTLRHLSFGLIAMLLATSATAETVYVDDVIYVPMRSGQGTQYRIIVPGVRSGTPLEVLDRGEEHVRVRLPDGKEGWIAQRYITNEPIARDRLERVNEQLEEANRRVANFDDQISEVRNARDEYAREAEELASRNEELQRELEEITAVSSNALQLEERNQELEQSNQKLRNDLEVLTAEKERLEDKSDSDFMLLGAGLVFFGMVLAVLVPMLKPTRKTDNWA